MKKIISATVLMFGFTVAMAQTQLVPLGDNKFAIDQPAVGAVPNISAGAVLANTIETNNFKLGGTSVTGIVTSDKAGNSSDASVTTKGYVDSTVATINQVNNNIDSRVTNNTTDIGLLRQSVGDVNNRVSALDARVTNVERAANRGVAGVAALSQVQVAADKDFAIGVGVANYRGEKEAAIGAAARINQNLQVRGGYTTSGVSAVGVSYSW